MKEKDEAKKMEEEHQKKVSQLIKSADGRVGLLHKITKPTVQILMKEEEDVKPMSRCEEKRKEWQIGK